MTYNVYYKIYNLYLKYTKSKPVKENELEDLKQEIGDEVLNTKLKDEEIEEIDIDFYFNKKDY